MRNRNSLIVQWLAAAAVVTGSGLAPGAAALERMAQPADAVRAAVLAKRATLAVPFVENTGQLDPRVSYHARLPGGVLLVTASGELVHALQALNGTPLVERFAGGSARPQGTLPDVTRVASFVGDPSTHRTGVRTFQYVALGEVFPGVDVTLRATGANVEKIFTVQPGADPRGIRMLVDGARTMSIGGDGALRVAAARGGHVAFTAPVAYQTVDGTQIPVPVAYALDGSGRGYGFDVGAYDASQPLVIDPLLQATYLGGDSGEGIHAIAVHPVSGDIFVIGDTSSTNFPCVSTATAGCANGAQIALAADPNHRDVFVARLSSDLTQLKQATYLGGNSFDYGNAILLHVANNEVIVAGATNSNNFPCVSTATAGCANAPQTTHGSPLGNAGDGFIARLSGDLTQLKQATYLGGNADDSINAIALHPLTGEIIVAGTTKSTNLACTTAGGVCGNGAQTAHASDSSNTDGFVARFSPDLLTLKQTTYFGGNGFDIINAMVVHPATGEIVVAGATGSTNLLCTAASGQCAAGAQVVHTTEVLGDGFAARFSSDLTKLLQATYLGGNGDDAINAMAVHPFTGEIFVAGTTAATDFPCTTPIGMCRNGGQPAHAADSSQSDGFVARLSRDLTQLRQATYIGGNSAEFLNAMAVHPVTGEIFVAGTTSSNNLPCTTASGVCGAAAVGPSAATPDAFVARFNRDLTQLRQTTYFGGGAVDIASALAIHPASGEVIIAGFTTSTNLPCTTAGGLCSNGAQTAHAADSGGADNYLARFTPDLTLADNTPAQIAFVPANFVPPLTLITSMPAQVVGLGGTTPVYVEGPLGSAYCLSFSSDCSCSASGSFISTPGTISDGQSVCVRHFSAATPGRVTESVFHVGGGAGIFRVATGGVYLAGPVPCSLDVDGNGTVDPRADGLLVMRALFGMTGAAVTTGAIGGGSPTRTTWAQIQPYLNGNCGGNFAP